MENGKLTPELQEKLKSAQTLEEMNALAEEEGFELSDEVFDAIAGGNGICNENTECIVLEHNEPKIIKMF